MIILALINLLISSCTLQDLDLFLRPNERVKFRTRPFLCTTRAGSLHDLTSCKRTFAQSKEPKFFPQFDPMIVVIFWQIITPQIIFRYVHHCLDGSHYF